ncbi:MAG: helix-turn-helix transcriptional regulator [Chloroflexi bacterium]|nr:helix-turn-helix transcriptional regulator [Chloroflexota bacterium]
MSEADDLKRKFGQRVRALRERLGISQQEFAHSVKLDRTYIGSVERGERNVSLVNIHKLAAGLNVRAEELLNAE